MSYVATSVGADASSEVQQSCMPDEQWKALPSCYDWYQKMPSACKKPDGPSPGNEQDACLEYTQRTKPPQVCTGYALLRASGAPQSSIDQLYAMPSCSGLTRPASEAQALAVLRGERTPSAIKPWMIVAGVALGGVLLYTIVKR